MEGEIKQATVSCENKKARNEMRSNGIKVLFDRRECRQVATQLKMGRIPSSHFRRQSFQINIELIRDLGNWIWRILLQSCQFKSSAAQL